MSSGEGVHAAAQLAVTPLVASASAGENDSTTTGNRETLHWHVVKRALRTQGRVIHALILRETLSRYGDHKLGFLWALVEPLLFVAILAVFMGALRSDSPGGMPTVPFMVTGFVPFIMFRNIVNQCRTAISANRSLLAFPQVTTFDVVIARILLESGVMLVVFAVILGTAHLIGFEFMIEDPLGVLLVYSVLVVLGSGIGFTLAALSPILPSLGQFTAMLLGRPLLFTSGLFFTAASIPEPFRTWLLYNPVLHIMELMRSSFFYEFESTYGSWSYVGTWAIGSMVIGLLTHRAFKRRTIVGL